MNSDHRVQLGYISGVFGVQGWVKVFSYTEPHENVLSYSHWLLGRDGQLREYAVDHGARQGKTLVARLEGINSREEAGQIVGMGIFVERSALPSLVDGEFYWTDLVGMTVQTTEGVSLGVVSGLMETGANDVLIVDGDRQRLIPFVQSEFVESVQLEQRNVVVRWDPDF